LTPPPVQAIPESRHSPKWRLSPALLQSGPFIVLICIVLAAPLILLITYAFRESAFLSVGPGPTFEQFQAVFDSASTTKILIRTITIALIVATATTFLSFVLAYGIRFRLRERTGSIALAVVIVAGVASFLVRIYAWGTILGTKGLINSALERIGLIDSPLSFLFFGPFAIVVTMVYLYLPMASLLVVSTMQGINRHDVQASRDLGAGRWRTVTRVVGPQARLGLMVAFALTAILSSADYITPQLVGGTDGQLAGSLVQSTALTNGDYPAAAALALTFLVLVLTALAVLGLLYLVSRGPRARLAVGIDALSAKIVPRTPGWIANRSFSRPASYLLVAYLVLPTLVVLVFSFNSGTTLGLPWKGFTLNWYPEAIDSRGFTEALWTSAKIATAAVVCGVAIGVPAAFALARLKGKRAAALRFLVFVPYMVPGVLLGVAVLVAASDQGISLGVTVTALVHMLIVTPVVVMVVNARIVGLNPMIVEAARDLGASKFTTLRTITMPLVLPAILGAALIGAAYSLDEILATTFTIGSETTLPIWLFGQARTGFTPLINAVGVMLMFGTLIVFAIAYGVLQRGFSGGGSGRRQRRNRANLRAQIRETP
jgi:ABC-type spermidine/putrescine transport system permease subunit II